MEVGGVVGGRAEEGPRKQGGPAKRPVEHAAEVEARGAKPRGSVRGPAFDAEEVPGGPRAARSGGAWRQ